MIILADTHAKEFWKISVRWELLKGANFMTDRLILWTVVDK